MDQTYNRSRIWSTNGFLVNEARQPTPNTADNFSTGTTVSGPFAVTSTATATGQTFQVNGIENGTRASAGKPLFHSNLVGVQSKFRRKYYHKSLLALLMLLVLILLIAIIVIALTHKKYQSNICSSRQCLRSAASLIYAMDERADPCDDFYKFTCGRWADEHPKPDAVTSNDWFRERQGRVMRTLRHFLQSNISDTEPVAVTKAKHMYRACLNTTLLDKLHLEPLLHFLHQFELPIIPHGLNITFSAEAAPKYASEQQFNWLRSLVRIKQHLGMDLMVGFDIFPDPLNRSVSRVALGTPETDSALPFNNDDTHRLLRKIHREAILGDDDDDDNDDVDDIEEEEEESAKQTSAGLTAYAAYVKKMMEYYVSYLDPNIDSADVGEQAVQMAMQAIKVARKLYKLKEVAENSTKPNNNPVEDLLYISVSELQNQTDKLIAPQTLPIWTEYLAMLLNESEHTTGMDVAQLTIITSSADVHYLQMLSEYLVQALPEHIEFYIWLSAMEELVLHTTSELRLLHTEYMRLIVGTEGATPRSLYCAHGVNGLMGMAVSYALVNTEFEKHTLPKVHRMLNDIRHAFDNQVLTTSWMDAATKHETLKKSASMKSFIGYPEWIGNETALNEHYAGIRVNASAHLHNMIGVLQWQMQQKLENLRRPEKPGWATAPSNVNAFHTFQWNAITIPIAILQFPFYDLGLEVLNYGSIGTILGHELTHGFDDSGRMFDKDGTMLQWWSNETITEYINRTECFIEQYNRFYLPDIEEHIDGELTLGENIADNGGMREAFNAYRLYVRDNGAEQLLLPGLEHYTHEQLFFISFGNLWCETYTPAASRYALQDAHCPGKIRLKGVLSNSQEFADAFNCPRGSVMNPDQPKCRIW